MRYARLAHCAHCTHSDRAETACAQTRSISLLFTVSCTRAIRTAHWTHEHCALLASAPLFDGFSRGPQEQNRPTHTNPVLCSRVAYIVHTHSRTTLQIGIIVYMYTLWLVRSVVAYEFECVRCVLLHSPVSGYSTTLYSTYTQPASSRAHNT